MNTIPVPDDIIFMVCDQPYVNSSLLLKLVEKKKEIGISIVASCYGNINDNNQIGIPALFHQNFFPGINETER